MDSSADLQRNAKEASQLINEARYTDEGSDRLYLLSHVFERIFYQEKLPNLLREFFYPLLEYESDKDPSIRKFIIGALESITRYNRQEPIQYALTALDVLLRMLNDEDESVVQRAMLCTINIYRRVLQLLAEEKTTSEAGKECWKQLRQLKDAMLKFIRISAQDTILCHAYKFVEVLILGFSSPEGIKPQKSDIFNLDTIPSKHPLLHPHSLKEEGEKLLSIFQDRLSTTLPSSCVIVIGNALVNISRQRPGFLGKIVPILLSTAKNPPPLSPLQIPSVVLAFKQALAIILRIRNPVVSGLSQDIQDVLSGKYKERERERDSESGKRKRPKEEVPDETEPKAKEQAVAPKDSQGANLPTSLPSVIPPNINVVELLGGLSFSLDMIVELIIENMSNFPGSTPTPPSSNAPIPTPTPPARVDPRRDPRLAKPDSSPEPTQPMSNVAPTPFQGFPNFPYLPGMMQGIPPVTPMPNVPPTSAPSTKQPFKEEKVEAPKPPVKKVEDNLPPMVIPTSFPSKVPPLTPVDCKRMSDQAFKRILNAERGVLIGGQAPLRQRIISFLAIQLDIKDPLIEELKTHILDNFSLRKDLAIAWLMAEYGKHKKDPASQVK